MMMSRSYLPLMLTLVMALWPARGDDLLAVARSNNCGKIVSLIQDAGLADALKAASNVTLLAPNDAAVDQLPADLMNVLKTNVTVLKRVLQFHVVTQPAPSSAISNELLLHTLSSLNVRVNIYSKPGGVPGLGGVLGPGVVGNRKVITVDGSPVVAVDLSADNGAILHVLGKVMYPLPTQTLPLTLTFTPDLSSLAYMIYTAQLIDALASEPFTVFAPSNAAIAKLGGQTYNDLLMNLTSVTQVLLSHVVKGTVYSEALYNGQVLTNLAGTPLTIDMGDSGVTVNNVGVSKVDIPATNGVIHVIDSVITRQ